MLGSERLRAFGKVYRIKGNHHLDPRFMSAPLMQRIPLRPLNYYGPKQKVEFPGVRSSKEKEQMLPGFFLCRMKWRHTQIRAL